MARFARSELESFHGSEVDDLTAPHPRLLFVGINPGLWTAAVNAHFARPGNRFWPALHAAGITPHVIDASEGMQPDDLALLAELGIGITNIVPTASARADELTRADLRSGGEQLAAKVAAWAPPVVAVLGLTAYRQAFGRPKAAAGRQDETLGGSELWVLPNPSGLNAHETVASLGAAYRAAWEAALAG
ncbi:MAG: mismatch-specific DNA-glycosylase [Acidimicrobiales bacterium]|nr:mismatch-specific DNA-glycosylase [Acidimicrobiales bacterium]